MNNGGYDTNPRDFLEVIKNEQLNTPQYEFRLTSEMIRDIKIYNREHTLYNFEVGDRNSVVKNGVIYYQSDFLRNFMDTNYGNNFRLSPNSYDNYIGLNNADFPNGISNVNGGNE